MNSVRSDGIPEGLVSFWCRDFPEFRPALSNAFVSGWNIQIASATVWAEGSAGIRNHRDFGYVGGFDHPIAIQ